MMKIKNNNKNCEDENYKLYLHTFTNDYQKL